MRSSVLIVALVLAAPPARADEETSAAVSHPWSPFALLVEVGDYLGVSAGAQVTLTRLGARVTGGWRPVVILASDAMTHRAESFHIYSTGQVSADAFALPLEGMPGVFLGLSGGYRWNSLLGHGFGAGIDVQIGRSRHIGWHISSGVAYFPDGEDRLIRDEGLPADSDFNFPWGAGLQLGTSVGIAFIP